MFLLFGKKPDLDGAWEEPGVTGVRIEIKGKVLKMFWMSSPVLETVFKTSAKDGVTVLKLKENGLRHGKDGAEYASVSSLEYSGGKLTLTETFPISGESRTVLSRTENTLYGDFDEAPQILSELQGIWKSSDGIFTLSISSDSMTLSDRSYKITVLKPRRGPGGTYIVADKDPSRPEFGGFTRPEYSAGMLSCMMMVCDAPSPRIEFRRI